MAWNWIEPSCPGLKTIKQTTGKKKTKRQTTQRKSALSGKVKHLLSVPHYILIALAHNILLLKEWNSVWSYKTPFKLQEYKRRARIVMFICWEAFTKLTNSKKTATPPPPNSLLSYPDGVELNGQLPMNETNASQTKTVFSTHSWESFPELWYT